MNTEGHGAPRSCLSILPGTVALTLNAHHMENARSHLCLYSPDIGVLRSLVGAFALCLVRTSPTYFRRPRPLGTAWTQDGGGVYKSGGWHRCRQGLATNPVGCLVRNPVPTAIYVLEHESPGLSISPPAIPGCKSVAHFDTEKKGDKNHVVVTQIEVDHPRATVRGLMKVRREWLKNLSKQPQRTRRFKTNEGTKLPSSATATQ